MEHVDTNSRSDPEVELMLRFKAGDDLAFDALYDRIKLPVYRYALRMLGEPQAAQEAAQDILVKVYRSRGRYQPGARFRTWLYRIATNHCINERRRAYRHRETATEEGTAGLADAASIATNPEKLAQGAELAEAIQSALTHLPERQRVAVVLARYEGCSMREIGGVLGITEGASKALLNRARVTLTQLLHPFLNEEGAS